MLAGEKSTEYASILWPYFSRPYETNTKILPDFFDKSDRLFESTVTKCANGEHIKARSFGQFRSIFELPVSIQLEKIPPLSQGLKRAGYALKRLLGISNASLAAGTRFASTTHRLRVA